MKRVPLHEFIRSHRSEILELVVRNVNAPAPDDSPPGKPDEFAPFVRKSPDRRGLGLGLGLARRAAEAHRGHISVTNLPGKGCVFCLALPMKASQGVARAAS